MNTFQLEQLCTSHPKLKRHFKGVFASNELPKFVSSYPAAFILNTQPRSKSGEHWVAIFLNAKYNGEYFDSYGFPPMNQNVIRFLKRNTAKWTYSKKVLQNPISLMCGGFCIYFLVKKSQGQSLRYILSTFKNNAVENDNKVNRFLKRVF